MFFNSTCCCQLSWPSPLHSQQHLVSTGDCCCRHHHCLSCWMPPASPLLECESSLVPVRSTQSMSQHALQHHRQSAKALAALQGQLCTGDNQHGAQMSKLSSLLLSKCQGNDGNSNSCSLTGLNDCAYASLHLSCDLPAPLVLLRLGLLQLARPEQAQLVQSQPYG